MHFQSSQEYLVSVAKWQSNASKGIGEAALGLLSKKGFEGKAFVRSNFSTSPISLGLILAL